MTRAIGLTGVISVTPGPIRGRGAPPESARGEIGQQYFDLDTSPPTQYIYNGVSWQIGGTGLDTVDAGALLYGDGENPLVPLEIGSAGEVLQVNSLADAPEWTDSIDLAGSIDASEITAKSGNIILAGEGTQLEVEGGDVTDFIGTGTLTAGVATVLNTNIKATDRIFIQRISPEASSAIGHLSYSIDASTSFTVTSLAADGSTEDDDVSTFAYFIVNQI